MKGLCIKDLRFMGNQKKFFLLVAVMSGFLLVGNKNALFVMGYAGFISAIFAINTIEYDEYDNGNVFLFTCPFSRGQYVWEKYILGMVLGILALVGVFCLSWILVAAGMFPRDGLPTLPGMAFFLAAQMLLLGVTIPIQLKFGAGKGRIAIFAIFMGGAGVVYLAVRLLEKTGADLSGAVETLYRIGVPGLAARCVAAAFLLMAAAAVLSVKILQKKEF